MISIHDINKRIRMKGQLSTNLINMREAQLFTDKNIFCKENAINSIKNWETLGDNIDDSFMEALNIFDNICEYCNDNTINECCNILIEGTSKVRDQKQLMNSLKYRIARLKKNKSTKITKKYNDVSKKIKAALTIKPVSLNGAPNIFKGGSSGVAKENAYERLYEECIKYKECDRIIETYNTLSKRFNIDKVLENIRTNIDIYEACGIISSYIDTYNYPFKNKYNAALEMCLYALDKHYMNYPKDKIIEAVTDYFILSNSLKESQYKDIKSIMQISVLYEQSDFSSISWMIKEPEKIQEETIDPNIHETYGVDSSILEFDLIKNKKKKEDNPIKAKVKEWTNGNPEEREDQDIKDMINDFRKQCTKDPDNKNFATNFKAIIYKIYSKSPYQIVNELPNLFAILRMFFIMSTVIIHPVLLIVSYITNEVLKLHLSRKQCEKVINAYKKEIDSVKGKIEKAKSDKTKERLEKYLEELKKDKEKIEYYERDLYTDAENNERDEAKWASEDNDDDIDDWDFNDDEDWGVDDWDFEEVAKAMIMSDMVQAISEGLIDTNVDGIVYNNLFKLDNDSIDALTDFSITVPVILEKEKLKESLIEYRNKLRESVKYTKDYIRIDCLNENIYKLNNSTNLYNTSTSPNHILNYLMCLKEFTKMNTEYIQEMEFSNTIKLAINKMKKDAVNLADKEKQASSMIDVAANNISRKLEDSIRSNNREAVIRGSILPSASKCIKLALLYGAAWCINPAIAIVIAIGHFACSKSMQKKERQLVLDDIELELKMCERYIKAAEDKNDLKKVREYEKLQRTLQRQKQRLQYKMLTIYNQKVPEIKNDND